MSHQARGGTPVLHQAQGGPCAPPGPGGSMLHQVQGSPVLHQAWGGGPHASPGLEGSVLHQAWEGDHASPGPKPLGSTESGRNMDLMAICPLLPIPPVP